jgi:hypothetical protein
MPITREPTRTKIDSATIETTVDPSVVSVLGSEATLARGVGVAVGPARVMTTATGFPLASTAIRTQPLATGTLSGSTSVA